MRAYGTKRADLSRACRCCRRRDELGPAALRRRERQSARREIAAAVEEMARGDDAEPDCYEDCPVCHGPCDGLG